MTDLYEAACAVLPKLPKCPERTRLARAVRKERNLREGGDVCEGCDRSFPDSRLDRYWEAHDPVSMGWWFKRCLKLLREDKNPPTWEAALRWKGEE